jgi:hypothetical protein
MLETLNVLARRFLPMIAVAISVPLVVLVAYLLAAILAGIVAGVIGIFFPMVGVVSGYLLGLAVLPVAPMVYCMFFAAAPVCIAEQAGIGTSLSRSRFLTKGHRWQIFGAVILIFVVYIIVSFVAESVAARTGAGGEGLTVVGPIRAVFVAFNAIVAAVFVAFNAVVAAVFYYQLRVAKDGVDPAKIASVFD